MPQSRSIPTLLSNNLTIKKADPSIVFDSILTGDTDFWMGVVDDAGSDDDDKFQLGDGATPGTNPFVTVDTLGNVGIGTISPTAVLHLKAGTAVASTAPLKFTSGPLNTTAEAGAIEFLTDAYYGTITTGAARKTFAFLESPSFTTPTLGVASATSMDVGSGHLAVGLNVAVNTRIFINTGNIGAGDLDLDGGNVIGANIAPGAKSVTAATGNLLIGVLSYPLVAGAHTQNITNAVGVRAFDGGIRILSGSTGTITGGASFYSVAPAVVGATLTNFYGVYLESPTAATNNYNMFFAGSPNGGSIATANNINLTIMPGGSGKIGIGTTSPTNILSFGGNSARTFWMERHTTADTAGNGLTVEGGGATAGATDKAGGNLVLKSGVATGTGISDVVLQAHPAGVTGTVDTTATEVLRLKGNGSIVVPVTITAPGTTGNQTINKAAGRVNIAAAGTTVTVTNSLVTANSVVLAVAATADATARVTSVVPAAGSFVINTVSVTAETAFNFLVIS